MKIWENRSMTWPELVERMSRPVRTGETMAEYRNMPRAQQADVKDVGGFVGGKLKDGLRKKSHVLCRSLVTLDMDNGRPGIVSVVMGKLPCTCFVYSTHRSSAEKPRLRVVIPLSRDVSAAEYGAISRMVAKQLGMELFDPTTFEPERLMYWGSVSKDGEYIAKGQEKELLDPDDVLKEYRDWQDVSAWPMPEGKCPVSPDVRKAEDPCGKKGLIGAFCRAWPMDEAIRTFLSDVYEPSVIPGRYDYKPADSSAGVVIYEGKFMISFHATDPLCGRLLNAFDAVRLHRFSHLDSSMDSDTAVTKLPSYKAMIDLAGKDERVKEEILRAKEKEAEADFKAVPQRKEQGKKAMTARLKFKSDGTVDNCLTNFLTILRMDEKLSAIAYNLLTDSVDVRGSLPWPRIKQGWSDNDMSQLNSYISSRYGIYAPMKSKDALITVASERQFHPIRDYFASLPAWDGKKRVETLLTDYLGAEDSEYTRAVTRKTLAAAVARVHKPGVKFDSVLILNGMQGVGKSTLFSRLGGVWFSDSLTLTDMRDKAAAEKLQGYFILELGELAGMKKADIETVKSFISRRDDKYRASYGITVESHPRQCIIVGTTNAENGFLRDITGNRRFWPVSVRGDTERKPWHLQKEEIGQIWAEAMAIWKAKEPLYLEKELLSAARKQQQAAMEADDREGLVRKYLDIKLPGKWSRMDLTERRAFLSSAEDLTDRSGTMIRDTVTHMEIYAECFGLDPARMRKQDSYDISAIMSRIGGWKR
ncbi:VapE domain-containing protein, partial [Dialister sp.]|uniref:VapE domain-containing protein n=1 Tax=Dialister sp. TaxID=1955814 RepID=UPI003F114F7E